MPRLVLLLGTPPIPGCLEVSLPDRAAWGDKQPFVLGFI